MLSTIIALNLIGQKLDAASVKSKFPPTFVSKAFGRMGIKLTADEISSSYTANKFYAVRRKGNKVFQVSYYANTDTFSLSNEQSGNSSEVGKKSREIELKSIAEKEFNGELVTNFLSSEAIHHLKPIPRSEPPNSRITFGWQSIINGFKAGYEGDYVLLSFDRATGGLVSMEMKRNVVYNKPRIVITSGTASGIAIKAIGKRGGDTNETNGELRYHLFPDSESRNIWKQTRKIRLKVGYYYGFNPHRACFVDAETGYLDVISGK